MTKLPSEDLFRDFLILDEEIRDLGTQAYSVLFGGRVDAEARILELFDKRRELVRKQNVLIQQLTGNTPAQ